MNNDHEIISKAACRLAADLPFPTLQIVTRFIGESSTLPAAKSRIVDLPHPHHRELATAYIDQCMAAASQITTEAVALALLTAGVSEKAHDDAQSVELVWTGPDTGAVPFRRTEQAIIQVLDSAQRRITVVREGKAVALLLIVVDGDMLGDVGLGHILVRQFHDHDGICLTVVRNVDVNSHILQGSALPYGRSKELWAIRNQSGQ